VCERCQERDWKTYNGNNGKGMKDLLAETSVYDIVHEEQETFTKYNQKWKLNITTCRLNSMSMDNHES
jgi:hypothetical protein